MQNLTVLFVEDHLLYRASLKNIIITLTDCRTCTFLDADNGIEALSILEENHVDMVITDISMPEMDGLALLGVLKENQPGIKVILITQYNELSYINEAIRLNADGYLLKNADSEEIVECLNTVINGGVYYTDIMRSHTNKG